MADQSESRTRPEEELNEASRIRRESDLKLTMSERLERLHHLCKQASELTGGKRPHLD